MSSASYSTRTDTTLAIGGVSDTFSVTTETGPATSATLSAGPVSSVIAGNSAAFTAGGIGGSGSYEYRFVLINGTTGTVVRSYSSSNTWTWNTAGYAAGAYMIEVDVRSAGSNAAYEAYKTISYSLVTNSPATGATLTAGPASPRYIGTQVTFTAGGIGGSGSYEYRFVLISGTTGTVVRSYSATNTWTWNTTNYAVGTYRVEVDVRNAGSPAAYEAYKTISYSLVANTPATGATLTASPATSQMVGNSAAFTAGGSGGSGSYEYRFVLINGTTGTVVRSYSTTNTWTWNTTGYTAGAYMIEVDVRSAGSSAAYEAYKAISYSLVTSSPATGATLTAGPASPQPIGTQVTFTAGGIGGSGSYEYKFILINGSTGTKVQNYSATNAWSWNTTGYAAGNYRVEVDVRNAGSTAAYEAYKTISFTINAP
jgi:hypothetical protein